LAKARSQAERRKKFTGLSPLLRTYSEVQPSQASQQERIAKQEVAEKEETETNAMSEL
jgi:hypothetical protein